MKPIVEKINLTNLGKCKVIILILVSIITFSLINSFNTVDASTTYKDGGITAVLDDNGTLTISGSGEITQSLMEKFNYKTSIKNVKIEDGVTSIGEYAFSNCKSLTSIEIPSSVTNIGNYAFWYCRSLISIEIPEGVTSIGKYAFSSCASLISIEIPKGVTSIGAYAFYGCTNLTSIEIPSSVTGIGDDAFNDCTSLERINVNQNNEKYTNDEKGVLYNKNKTELIRYPAGKKDTEYSIPEGVTSIGDNAFENCTSLISIEIPSSVTNIAYRTFRDCASLISIEIPEGVTSIGKYAFYGCENLTSIEIPEGVTSIGDYAFYGCENLTSIEIPEGVTSIGAYVFNVCTSLERINVNQNNEKYTNDEKGVLYNKNKTELIRYPAGKKDTEYSIPEGVTSIGDTAFENCTSLISIEIPSSVTNIAYGTFSDCASLISIEIPEGVTSIGKYAFSSCASLISIEIPKGVTSIGAYAFSGCTNLTSIEIPKGVTSIGYDAFSGCTNLTSIEIPSSVTSIGDAAFNVCENLTSIEIPEGVTSIGAYAFYGCENLTSIEIPSSVTSIGYGTFNDCTSLERINVNQNNEKYTNDEKGVLYNKNKTELIQYPAGKKDTEYSIPEGVTSIGAYAFYKCTSLTSIVIPSSVTDIGDDVFYNCKSLTIYCKSNTTALQYAIDNKIDYVIDDEGPELIVIGNPENWTKGEVTLTIQASDKLSGLKNVKVNSKEITITEGTGTYKVKVNGTYTVIATDNLGNTKTQTVEVTKIDNDEPELTVTGNPENWTKGEVTIQVSDKLSGLKNVKVNNEEITIIEGIGTYKIKANGTYTVIATDNAENTKTQTVEVTKIDNDVPELKVTGNPENWTKGEVMLTIQASDKLSGLKNVKVNNEEITIIEGTGTYKVKENGTYTVIATDNLGNTKTQTVEVTKIDNDEPELTVAGNPENWTKGEVTLTIQANDKLSGLKNVKVNSEEITITEGIGTYKVKENGTYTVIATDNAENTKTQTVEVTKIDNDMPTKTKPTAESTIKSITVTCKQTDENSGLQKVEYAIYKDNSWSNWQTENVFEGLSKKTSYKVKTRATDKAGNIEESEETIIETKELGDINKNNKIDIADILQILRHMSAEKTQKNKDWLLSQEDQEIADVNQNKKVDVQDALLIRRYIAANKNESIAQKHPDWIK